MKKSKIFLLALLMVIAFSLVGCGQDSTSEEGTSDEAEAETAEVVEDTVLAVGEPWVVDGQWQLTIDSVEVTADRNEYEESVPAQVIMIHYSYENLGYEDPSGIWNGLYMSLDTDTQVIDSQGNMCRTYPLGDSYPQETPVGAKCSADACYGLVAEGSPVKMIVNMYDANMDQQEATFELTF